MTALPFTLGCRAERSRALELGYMYKIVEGPSKTVVYPWGVQLRGAFVSLPRIELATIAENRLYVCPGAALEWGSPLSGTSTSVGARFFIEMNALKDSVAVSIGTGISVVGVTEWEDGSYGGGFLGLGLLWLPERRNGFRVQMYYDWLSDSVRAFSSSAGWIVSW